jgi:hypothetical protein
MELRGDEDLLASEPAVMQGSPDAFFVAIRLGRVNVAVAQLQRPPDRALAFGTIANLPHAEA